MTTNVQSCPLCAEPGGIVVWQNADWRAVRVADTDFPAFYRLIAAAHVEEFTDLAPPARARCIALVSAIEKVLRDELEPIKINLASLGNMVAHLHWHVIARFDWDSHFPNPIWGERLREVAPAAAARLPIALPALDHLVATALAASAGPPVRG
ncbi:MAG: HIT family protein [Proteobacteria bacterium]|nr:HIT family protein [Pseudomonadota bacterium]